MLKNVVKGLIALQHEGSYWDFKKCWHNNKADLLIDIICMANNLENCDGYIIIGVDENAGFQIVNTVGDANRKNTQNLNDFLKDKHFAGEVRPTVRVDSLDIGGTTIDVIVIVNSYNTPFTITVDYRDQGRLVKAYHVYTRVQDTNTPSDSSADVDKVEWLYRKRFRLHEAPLQKAKYYLGNPDGWEESPSMEGYAFYYKHTTEQFTIRFKQDNDNEHCEFWSLMFPASGRNNSLNGIEIIWNGIVLSNDYFYAPLDDGRAYCVMPKIGAIQQGDNFYRYFYLIKGTLLYALYEFIWVKMYQSDISRYRGAIEQHFIIFEDEYEKSEFERILNSDIEGIVATLDAKRLDPKNNHLQDVGFYYGFSNLDKNDYLDSQYFSERYRKWSGSP